MPRSSPAPKLTELIVANHALEAQWRRALGISAYEMLALIHLGSGPLVIGDLGKRLSLTSGAMTGLVDRLVGAGFVQRVRDPADGRRVLLELTELAVRRLEESRATLDARLGQVERSMSADERAIVARYLQQVHASIHALGSDER